MEIILTLDPATSTGYSLTRLFENGNYEIYEVGFIDVDTSSNYQGDHCLDLMRRIKKLIKKHDVKKIAIEDFFFSRKFRNGSNVNGAFRTAIHILARHYDIPYTILNISAWKVYIGGRANPTKEDKKKWGVEPAKKLYIQEALWKRYRIKFPNHSISETTGKPICFRLDIVDVVAQTIYYCEMIEHAKTLTYSVMTPDDITWKKTPKKLYVYE